MTTYYTFSPLEQFSYTLVHANPNLGIFDFYIDTLILNLLFLGLTLTFFNYVVFNSSIFEGWGPYVNSLLEVIVLIIKSVIGSINFDYLFFFLYLFFSLLISNTSGVVTYTDSITSQYIVCFNLGFFFFFWWNFVGSSKNKFKIFSLFFPNGSPLMLSTLIVPIEFISYTFRVISVSVRLFANMMAGHTLLKIIGNFGYKLSINIGYISFFSIFPFIILFLLSFLEFGISFIQTYVFFMLTLMYFRDGVYLH